MELPKNIVQIGTPDPWYHVYIEDYVVSYMKQMMRQDQEEKGMVFYGKRKEESTVKYYFIYGAAQLDYLKDREQYLSALEKEEIERIRLEYFPKLEWIGWTTLETELPESLYLLEGGKGSLVHGYHCFYEKNETMLEFMISQKQKIEKQRNDKKAVAEEVTHTVVGPDPLIRERRIHRGNGITADDQAKQLERIKKVEYMKGVKAPARNPYRMVRICATAMSAVLCFALFLSIINVEQRADIMSFFSQAIESMKEQKIPDTTAVPSPSPTSHTSPESDTAISDPADTSDTLNTSNVTGTTNASDTTSASNTTNTPATTAPSGTTSIPDTSLTSNSTTSSNNPPAPETDQTSNAAETVNADEAIPTEYIVQKGDTLISICKKRYGNLDWLDEVCEINALDDADSIEAGQTILLP